MAVPRHSDSPYARSNLTPRASTRSAMSSGIGAPPHVSPRSAERSGRKFNRSAASSIMMTCDVIEVAQLQRLEASSRSEEHTSELKSLMSSQSDVFYLDKTNNTT